MGVTAQLAAFVVDTAGADIPPQAYARAKEAMLDGLGCALVGSPTPMGKLMTRYVHERSETPGPPIGSGFKTSAALAALANGTMAYALDFDDNWSMSGHPTVPLLPALLALGQEVHASGSDVLLAYALGFEVETKIGLGVNPGITTWAGMRPRRLAHWVRRPHVRNSRVWMSRKPAWPLALRPQQQPVCGRTSAL